MARRSARLQKQSPAPTSARSDDSRDSWETAPSREQSPAQAQLPAVAEAEEPTMKTPQKRAAAAKTSKASQLPQPATTPSRTPSNRTPIKPAGTEMHPAHHHASTAKFLDEARWLGFQALGAHTAPPKPMGMSAGQDTPTKATPGKVPDGDVVSPDTRFRFRFKSPLNALSPSSSRILKDTTQATEGRGLFKANEFTAPVDMTPKRKTVVPKGKMARFSDIHMKEFKKMDSIANHPSAFRAKALQASSSKPDLTKAETSAKTPNTLKRTQSKMDLLESMPKAPASALKRTQSKVDVAETTTKIAPTPLKRTQSKMDMSSSSLPRAQTIRAVPPSRDGPRPTQEANPFAKRVKRTEADDAATTRPISRDGPATNTLVAGTPTPARKKTGLPRLADRLMTPTKSSIARSQSVKPLKSQSMISGPSLLRSPSTKNLFSPTNAGTPSPTKNIFSPTNISNAVRDGVRDGIRKTSSSLQRVRSILRTPSRKFSDDPTKVAAGTHMSPPSALNTIHVLPAMPKTAPVKKQVNFTNSTLERAAWDEVGKSPSPMKLRAGSEIPSGAVIYPSLGNSVEYPTIPEGNDSAPDSPSRRLTFGGATATTPAAFSFQSDKPIDFGPPSTGTIRMVRKSDASSLAEGKKRKLDTVSESSDKENSEPAPDAGRSAKKVKTAPAEVPQTPAKSASKLPRRTPRGGSLTKSRLAFLATPKRGKA
ncbi:uncharacterized protein CC84DRAFT_1217528 [Paraphaeosphaeria sporulosa]|uniref:Uncharacterized protein n=1 Tax=Paraphaeosphaeria sporulosa TaxID=1460663 RepID=A0A177CHL1_9PLEO|nr:uncharacterized protein CC84DRAFT_1217528 [Paraphaeosphaeria sporulosa]OAG06280.1 hypothetical protein CC84DRAFT_1217528 [Paraphaeosphaeria sporulosa]